MILAPCVEPILRVHPTKLTGEGGLNYIKVVDRIGKDRIYKKDHNSELAVG